MMRLDETRLVVLALAINFRGFTTETLYCEQQALCQVVEAAGGKVIFYGPGFDYPTNDVSEMVEILTAQGKRPNVILSYLSENLFHSPLPANVQQKYELPARLQSFPRGIEKVKDIPKVMWINDFWHMTPGQWETTLLTHGFRHVIATYAPPFLRESEFRSTFSERVRKTVQFFPSPRGINSTIFCEYDEERSVDVTLLGAMGKFYPLRDFFHQTLSHQSWINYFHRHHPGYDFDQPGSLTGVAYAKALARSKIFVSCAGLFSLPFIKIYEVLACGTLLMCDRPCGAEQLGLVDGKTYVEVDRTNFLPKLKYYLEHQGELAAIAKAGQELYFERFTDFHNAQRVAAVLAGVVKADLSSEGVAVVQERVLDATADVDNIPTQPVSPAATDASRMMVLISKIKARMQKLCERTSDHPTHRLTSGQFGWAEVKGGSCLDWVRVTEVRHALEVAPLRSLRDLELIERYGLNYLGGAKPVVTQHAETVALRPIILKLLASALDSRIIGEIGTARGLQSIFWADYLAQSHPGQGKVFTCDIVGHDDPVFRTPLSADVLWTRRELWAMEPVSTVIEFVHGDSAELRTRLLKEGDSMKIDLLYIDARHDEESVLADYGNMSRLLAEDAVLVFDDCDPRFPGVEAAVNRIAADRGSHVRLITFWPSVYTVAVLGNAVSLKDLVPLANGTR